MSETNSAMTLGKRSLMGLVLGLIAGGVLYFVPECWLRNDFLIDTVFKIVGNGYLNLLKMTIAPFVFASLVMGISSATDVRQVGRIGIKILAIYFITTTIATTFGILGGLILKPGAGLSLGTFELSGKYQALQSSFADVMLGFIPTNIVASFANGNMIHIVIFAVFVGVAMSLLGTKAEAVKRFNEDFANVMLRIVNMVISITPFGVFALMATTVANLGFGIIYTLAKYCVCEIFLFFLFGFCVYGGIFTILARENFFHFLAHYFRKVAIIPFSTSSSNATIPYSIQFCRSIGVSNKVASFTIPLGATVNMDGTAIMQGMTAVFVAQLYGIDMTWVQILTIVIAATMGSIGSPGMPGVVMATLVVVLSSVGFPLEVIGLIVSIDKFPDMFKTVLNVMGDSVCTTIVAKSEGEFDREVFYGRKAPQE